MAYGKENISSFNIHDEEISQYREAYDFLPCYVKLLSIDGHLVYMNTTALKMIEADNVQQITEPFLGDLIEGEHRVALQNLHHLAMSGEKGTLELQIQSLNRNRLWLETHCIPVHNKLHTICAVFFLAFDISKRKFAEQSLLESEQLHSTLVQNIPQQIWATNALGELIFVNHQVEVYFGEILENYTDKGWMNIIHPEDLPEAKKRWSNAFKTGTPYNINYRLKRSDNTYRWHICTAHPIFDNQHQITLWFGTNTDIDSLRNNEAALRESESSFAATRAGAKMGSWHRDLITGEGRWSLEMYRLFCFDPTKKPPSYQEFEAKIHPDDLNEFKIIFEKMTTAKGSYSIDFRYPDANGKYVWLESTGESITNKSGTIIAITGTAQNINQRKNIERAYQTSKQLLNASQAIAKLGGWELDLITKELFWTDETYRIHDTSPDQFNPTLDAGIEYFLPESRKIMEDALKAAIEYGQPYDLELEKLTTLGRRIDVRTTCEVTMHEGKAIRLTGVFQDITQQKSERLALLATYDKLEKSNRLLEHIAHYDPLTDLPNRVLLADRMDQAMLHCQRRKQSLAVAFLDLDGFKDINDKYGHSAGDQFLIEIAHRLKLALREGDTLARLGGDEFVAILTDLNQGKDCEPILERLLLAAAEPLMMHGSEMRVSASIGVTIYPQDGADADQLLRHADQAMYMSKEAGKNRYHLFDVEHNAAIKNQRDDLSKISHALVNHEFVLFYQPKVNMRTGKIIGAEALIRWQHPQKGLLAPAAFLPIIENDILSIALGEWVIATGLSQIAQWKAMGITVPVSVNVGALQLQQIDFSERLEQLLRDYPESIKRCLELEILETSALGDITQISKVIHDCQALGVSFALDDFGTGYSSLSHLKQLPAQMLKIDQSFVRDMLEDEGDLNIIKGIIGLASAFNRHVIAEGVETTAHGNLLLSLGCELAQGYGIARPMPASAIPAWIKTWRPEFTKQICETNVSQ